MSGVPQDLSSCLLSIRVGDLDLKTTRNHRQGPQHSLCEKNQDTIPRGNHVCHKDATGWVA